jgi:hypothetical protein
MPDNSEYCLGLLVDRANDLLDVISNQEKKEKPLTFLCKKLGIEKLDGEEDERQVRKKINEILAFQFLHPPRCVTIHPPRCVALHPLWWMVHPLWWLVPHHQCVLLRIIRDVSPSTGESPPTPCAA